MSGSQISASHRLESSQGSMFRCQEPLQAGGWGWPVAGAAARLRRAAARRAPASNLKPSTPVAACSARRRCTNQATAAGLVKSSAATGAAFHQRKKPGRRNGPGAPLVIEVAPGRALPARAPGTPLCWGNGLGGSAGQAWQPLP